MNLPDKCPFCGEGVAMDYDGHPEKSDMRVEYECQTVVVDGYDRLLWQSDRCEKAQKAQAVNRVRDLEARVAELEARCKRLETAGDAMLSAWLMPEDSMSYSDWVCISSDAKSGWYAAKETKP